MKKEILGAHFLLKLFFGNFNFKTTYFLKSGPIFDVVAKLGKTSMDAYNPGLWLIVFWKIWLPKVSLPRLMTLPYNRWNGEYIDFLSKVIMVTNSNQFWLFIIPVIISSPAIKNTYLVKWITHDLNHDLTFYCTHNQLCVPQYKVNVWSTWSL